MHVKFNNKLRVCVKKKKEGDTEVNNPASDLLEMHAKNLDLESRSIILTDKRVLK